jgi:hypothetical protein
MLSLQSGMGYQPMVAVHRDSKSEATTCKLNGFAMCAGTHTTGW